jgi:hypothetical protein
VNVKLPALRILDADIENRPLSYLGSDFTTADITAIAAGWVDQKKVYCWAIPESTTEEMLAGFVALYDQADIVTGHYLRKHDLPHINGALIEFGMRPLSPKLVSDTKIDLVKRAGISASQENLAEMFGLPEPKYQMNQVKWREANRLTPKGVSLTKKRVISDVQQHKALRLAMIEAEILGPPRMWAP